MASEQEKLLLVDDEVAVRNLYQLFFESHGFSVVAASSIGEALRVLKEQDIALAMIDIFLHGENGLDLLKGIVAARPEFPVVIISGIGPEQPQFREALEAGARAVFTKTQSLSLLLSEVRRVLAPEAS